MHHKDVLIKKRPALQKGHKIAMKSFHYSPIEDVGETPYFRNGDQLQREPCSTAKAKTGGDAKKDNASYDLFRAIGVASSAGITLFICIGGCICLGYVFDEYIGKSPWGLLVGGIIGGFGGLYMLYKQVVSK